MNFEKKYLFTIDENKKVHSVMGQPAARYFNGTNALIWCEHDIVHRNPEEGPSYISNNECVYYVNGYIHNEIEYPAVIRRYESHYILEYWTNGRFIKSVKVQEVLKPLGNYFMAEENYNGTKKHGNCKYTHFNRVVNKRYYNGLDLEATYYLERRENKKYLVDVKTQVETMIS